MKTTISAILHGKDNYSSENHYETTMLSHYELATLILVRDAPDQVELNQPDLSALLERGLVSLERRPSGTRFPRVTTHGSFVLRLLSPAYFHAVE